MSDCIRFLTSIFILNERYLLQEPIGSNYLTHSLHCLLQPDTVPAAKLYQLFLFMLSAILSHFRQHNTYIYLCSFSFLPNTPVCPTGHANRKYHRAFKPTLFCTAQFLSSDHEDANPPFLITLAITMLLVDTNVLYKWYLLSYPLTMLAHFLTPFLFFLNTSTAGETLVTISPPFTFLIFIAFSFLPSLSIMK